ncbi:hypothetical protein [Paenibacillus cymbidii]|uniref:hypothetical protein n=1 Tax=Paenibacillus cymbidii TaxID=1639034 RepID=UPI001F2B49D7|nr:hypothetical protein [Paenibacillus cymbidii]
MGTPLEVMNEQLYNVRTTKAAKPRKHTYKLLFATWLLLIGSGVYGTWMYSQYMRAQITTELSQQTQQQLTVVQADYDKQIADLKTAMNGEMAALQAKVDSLNELLAFTKDSANSKTDNSNQLYTQLAEVKKKLEELQKNLDVLK